MSSCLQLQEHLDSVSIQLSVDLCDYLYYSVNLHALLLLRSSYRESVIEFCVSLHFNQIQYLLNAP